MDPNHFGRVPLLLDVSICFGSVQIMKISPKKSVLNLTIMIWTVQNTDKRARHNCNLNPFFPYKLCFTVKCKYPLIIYLDLDLASEANVKCPQIVINFYEDRLTFCSSTKDKKE